MDANTALALPFLVPFFNRTAAANFDPAEWFQLVPKGSFPITRKEGDTVRTYVQVVDDVACTRIAQAFANRQATVPGYQLLIDFEHFSHDTSKSSAAACWVNAMEVRADGVWAKGNWSDEGEAAIKNRRYRFLSPVWFPRQTEPIAGNRFRPIEVNDAGLTNKPNLGDALQPFWNRAEETFHGREAITQTRSKGNAMKDRLIPLLKIDANSTEDQVVAAVSAFMNRASELDALKGTHATLTSEHAALLNRHTALLTVSVDGTLKEFAGIIAPTAVEAWKNRLTADFDGTVLLLRGLKPAASGGDETKIDAALKEFAGVITAESQPAWKNRLASDFDGTVALLKGIKKPAKKTPVHGEDKGGKGALETAGADEVHPFMNRVSAVMVERKLDKADAIGAVAGEEPALYANYRESITGGE